jgi:hypothetical protein
MAGRSDVDSPQTSIPVEIYPFSNASITDENRFNAHSEELEPRIRSNGLIESAAAPKFAGTTGPISAAPPPTRSIVSQPRVSLCRARIVVTAPGVKRAGNDLARQARRVTGTL